MVYHYRANDPVSGRWSGTTSGVKLSSFQGDENIYTLDARITATQAMITASRGVISITSSLGELTFNMSDSTSEGPFPMPVAVFLDRGTWAALTAYAVNDTFSINGTLYRVLFAHTSAATFSAGANDGLGHDYYSPMMSSAGSSLPTGGATAQVLQKSSSADYVVSWSYKLPTGGTTYQVLLKLSSTNQDANWTTLGASMVSFTPPTGSPLTATNVADALEQAALLGGGGALSGLSDVNVTEGSGINGYFLTWNNATSKWVAAAASSNLSGLADVNVTEGSGINGYFLQWDIASGKWIAATSSASLSGLTDVNVTEGAGIDGQFLKWNNGTTKWISSTVALSILADVNVTEGSGINGYFLKWDNATSRWVASLTGATAVALSGLSDVNVTEGSGIDGFSLQWSNATSKWVATTKAQPFDAQLFSNIPQNSKSAAYTTVLTDAQKHIFHPAADTTARTFTIDSNANVPYPIGTAITIVNQHGAGVLTIAVTSDTQRLAGAGTTGNRTLAADGIATWLKIATTEWICSGTGLA